jgi:putative ABC transport system permease protein
MLRRGYALLLRCYPPAFRARFGSELQFAFEAGWHLARRRGLPAAIRFLLVSAIDAVVNGGRERRSNRWYSPRARRDSLVTTFLTDMRFGLRLMIRTPQLAALAICTLGLGIGLSVSLYSVAHGALVRPLPFREETRVVMMYEHAPQRGTIRGNVAPANFLDWRARTSAFSAMGALRPFTATVIGAGGEAVRADGRRVLGPAFDALGLDPLLGRVFNADDEQPGRSVMLMSHRFWQQHFGGDPTLIGRSILVDERPQTVVGILKPVLRVPGGPIGYDEIFVPWVLTPQQRQGRLSHISEAVARVKDGVTLEQAQADIARVADGLAREYPQSNKDETVLLVPLREVLVGDVKPALMMLVGAVTLVLLIACVNVANLLLARATARRQEMTMRAALGAGRARLVRQLLAESLVLALAAGAFGVVLAWWSVELLRALLPGDLAATIDARLDWRVTLGATAVCVLTAMIAGLAPAGFVLRSNATAVVRQGRGAGGPAAAARHVLVTVQVALAVVLLAGAGLLMRSFLRLMSVDPGIRPDRVLTLTLELPQTRYAGPEQWQPFFERLLADLRALPGVTHAAGIGGLPFNENGGSVGIHVEGQPTLDNEHTYVIYRLVTPGYFETIGIPLIEGRDFSRQDGIKGPRVAAVNETLARRYWPGQTAVGKRVAFRRSPRPEDFVTIVAVVGDTHHWSLAEPIDIQMYVPYTQDANWLTPNQIALRSSGEPTAVASAARARVRAIDPLVPVSDIQTMESLIAKSVAAPRFNLTLLGLLSLSALGLAMIGIYGLLAFSVALRTREIGVRSALGASQSGIARMILGEGLRLTAAGIVVGLTVAFAATRWIQSLLFEVEPSDPATFMVIAVLLLAIAVIACYLPARRAARVDPLLALRAE